jgi:hypothetical protein
MPGFNYPAKNMLRGEAQLVDVLEEECSSASRRE